MKGFPDLPPLWWLGAIGVIYLFKWLLPGIHVESGVLLVLSRLVLIGALGLIGWSAFWFWRKKTPIEPHHEPKSLIVEGPYRVTRNPIYLALVMLCVASAMGNGSVIGLIVAAGLWWVLDTRFAATEEGLLVDQFGDDARGYLAQTKRWI